MNQDYRKAKISAFVSPQSPNYPEYPFYGESGFYSGGFPFGQQQHPVPFGQSAAGGTGFNIQEIKNVIDRMGGIDGILNTMQKVSKMVQTVQQMAPMLKVLLGSFGKKASTTVTDDEEYPARRRKKRRGRRRRRRRR
jgi:hypothetical protein